mgnify:FL=1
MNIEDNRHSFPGGIAGECISDWKCIRCGIPFYMSLGRSCTQNAPHIQIIESSIKIEEKENKYMDEDLTNDLNDQLSELIYFLKGAAYSCSDENPRRAFEHACFLVRIISEKLNGVEEGEDSPNNALNKIELLEKRINSLEFLEKSNSTQIINLTERISTLIIDVLKWKEKQ